MTRDEIVKMAKGKADDAARERLRRQLERARDGAMNDAAFADAQGMATIFKRALADIDALDEAIGSVPEPEASEPSFPVRLHVMPRSAARADLVLRRGLHVQVVLGTWSPQRGWDLTAAGCQAERLFAVLPTVMARQGIQEDWFPRGEAGAAPWDGNRRAAAPVPA